MTISRFSAVRAAARRTPLAALVAVLAACAPAMGGAGGGPGASSADVDGAATLLRLEDRREYDAAAIESAAGQASPALRRRAALAAGRIGDRRATPLLARLLADADTSVAASAAFALGELGDTTAAVTALVPYVTVGRIPTAPTVVGEAAMALGKMPTPAGKQAVEALLRDAPRAGAGIQQAVGQALLAVWRFPRPADAAPIIPWLDSADPEIRWRAAYALSRRPDPRGTEALFAKVSDSNALVRSFAMRALTAPLADSSSVGAARAFDALVAATRDADHAVSVNAVRSLGSHRTPASVARLQELLTGGDAYLAITAAETLGRLGTFAAQSGPSLRAVAADGAKPIFLRTSALAALAEVAPADARAVADAMSREEGWRSLAAAARVFGALRDWERLRAFAEHQDGRVAAAAVEAAVAAAGDSVGRIRALLREALDHPDVVVRTNALNALAPLGDLSMGTQLLDAYQRAQSDSILNDAALAAVDALGVLHRRDPSIADAFFDRFPRSNDYLIRQRVAAAFGNAELSAWGAPLPIETGKTMDDYRALVRQSMARPTRRARIVTDRGTIDVELFAADAPLTVENFLSLARRGFFDGQEWPRVVPNFVVQGGDPRGDTSGGPGYAIRDEINRHPYLHGTLGMALSGPDTGGSQWFLTHSPQPHLDGGYTVFGRVAGEMDVVGRILPGDRILRIEEVR